MTAITPEEAVRRLNALGDVARVDPETAHARADHLLLESVPQEVREAYLQVISAADWWSFA